MTRRAWFGWLVAAAVAASAFGVYQLATESDGYARFRPVRASELKEAALYFPGSTVIARRAVDMEKPILGAGMPASIYTTLGVDASPAEVIAWYEQRLTALGYRDGDTARPPVTHWQRGSREDFYLYILRSGDHEYIPIAQQTEYFLSYGVGFD